MVTQAEARRWANEQGMDVPARGPLSNEVMAAYNAEHDEGPDPDPGFPGFPVSPDAPDVSEPGPPPADLTEARPRAVKTPRGRGLAVLAGRARGTGGTKTGKAKRKGPVRGRVPVDKLIATGWRLLATAAKPLPATSRLLTLQAPVAGLVLEDTIRGTVVDRLLQPIARAEEGGKAVFALLGPPLIVTMMQSQPAMFMLLLPALRESLLYWCEIAGPLMEKAVERETTFEGTYGKTVDDMIAVLFAPPPQTPEEKAADDEALAGFAAAAAAAS